MIQLKRYQAAAPRKKTADLGRASSGRVKMLNEAIDHALHEVQAARRDLTLTTFCVRQAEALRRLDRAKASLADLMQSRNHYRASHDNASITR